MQITVSEVGGLTRKLKIVLPKEEVSKELDAGFNKIKNEAKIKGYRRGKVPRHVLERGYGQQVRAEVAEKLMSSLPPAPPYVEAGEAYEEIPDDADDARARRITAYLDLVHRQVKEQMRSMQSSLFEAGSELTKYFDMLLQGIVNRNPDVISAGMRTKEGKLSNTSVLDLNVTETVETLLVGGVKES